MLVGLFKTLRQISASTRCYCIVTSHKTFFRNIFKTKF